ncbi:MAG TPA: HEAT repeat domain-containing protein [Thermoanaerobaculia bacterium]
MTDSHSPETAEEDEQPPKASAVRFFLLPLLVVGAAVAIFLVFNLMTFDRRSPAEYLQEVRGGGPNRRWQAAFELSREVSRIPPGRERDALAAETLRIFEGLSRSRPEDVPVRRYLVLVLGKLGNRAAVPVLLSSAKDPDSETRLYSIWALGVLADPRALDTVLESSQSEDPGARKMAAYVLGRLGSHEAIPRLKVLLEDSVADVRWNAAIALASLGDRTGLPVLRSMIDRESLARLALTSDQTEAAMVNALKALSLLRDAETLPLIEKIERGDPNLRVREAARQAAQATRGAAATPPGPSSMNVERRAAVLVV